MELKVYRYLQMETCSKFSDKVVRIGTLNNCGVPYKMRHILEYSSKLKWDDRLKSNVKYQCFRYWQEFFEFVFKEAAIFGPEAYI